MRKPFSSFVVVATLSIGLSAPLLAGPVSIGSGGRRAPDVINVAHLQTMQGLWRESEQRRQLDGGTLTPEHQAMFQRRLDRANDQYRRQLANNNPLTVDADGHPNSVNPNTDWTWSDLARVGASN